MKKLYPVLLFCSLVSGVLSAETPKNQSNNVSNSEIQASESNNDGIGIDLSTTIDNDNSTLDDQSPSFKAKFGSGLTITTANESFSIQFRGRFQSLVQVDHYYHSDRSAKFGAQIRRARFKIAGHVGKGKESADDVIAGKHKMRYTVQFGFANKDVSGITDGKGVILDAYLTYSPNEHVNILFGQTKLPGNREGITSSQKQQFVDRGVTSGFRLDRDFGFQIRTKFGEKAIFKPMISVAVGEGRNTTAMSSSGLDYTFRFDLLPLGDFHKGKGDYVMSDIDREPKPKLALGAAYDFNHEARFSKGQRGGTEVAQSDRSSIHTVFADALFKFKGLSLFTEFAHRAVGTDYRSSYSTGNAVTAAAGYVCKKKIEVAARYNRTMPLDNISLDKDMRSGTNSYTLAASKYFLGHNLKIQTDYTLFDAINANSSWGVWRFQVEVAF